MFRTSLMSRASLMCRTFRTFGADASEPQGRERTMRTAGDSRASNRTRTEEMLNPTDVGAHRGGAHRGGVFQGAQVHGPRAWGSWVSEALLPRLAADRRVA
ncbi:hypothetical protein GCM10010269_00680 [Streptomyces humidus]|uniref:Uncharacterized protein n=1 Tax=Streptomyces humidus TaxID=52259 RepID=A0A918FPU8_9ACTN|nr:hypothetical protein GCM10010269_00680 [Streptomyces humidus]